MRIYIGHISPALAGCIDELEKRLVRHGALQSPISLHRKPLGDYYFAYVDMDLDDKQFHALVAALNGLTFKQSKLLIQQARPNYEARLQEAATRPVPKYNPEQLKRKRSRPSREIDVYHARERSAPAPRDEITFRVMIKGRLHRPKPRKRKLWGVERRPLARLVDHFADGEWRDSEDKAVEIVAALHDEHERDQRIADELAQKTAYLSDSDFEEFRETKADLDPATYSDDEIEVVPRSGAPAAALRAELDSDDDNDDNEVGSLASGAPIADQPVTESLRSALSVERPFTLFSAPDEAAEPVATQREVDRAAEIGGTAAPAAPIEEPKVGLFFDHTDSPYLRSQTMAARLVTDFDPVKWEASFWENQGEWNRALRRRRKDVAKLARKSAKWR